MQRRSILSRTPAIPCQLRARAADRGPLRERGGKTAGVESAHLPEEPAMAIATPFQAKSTLTEAEREARVNLAAMHRLAVHYGWDDLIYNHFAARIPGERFFLMKRLTLMFDEVT